MITTVYNIDFLAHSQLSFDIAITYIESKASGLVQSRGKILSIATMTSNLNHSDDITYETIDLNDILSFYIYTYGDTVHV